MKTLPGALITAKNRLCDTYPWLVLLEIINDDWETIPYDGLTRHFHEGATASTPTGTASIKFDIQLSDTTGILVVYGRSGTFSDNQNLSDNGSPSGLAKVNGTMETGEARIRLARNTASIYYTYLGKHFYAFPFEIQPIQDSRTEVPVMAISVSNVSRFIEAYANQSGGLIGKQMRIMMIYAGDLGQAPALDQTYYVLECSIDIDAVSFSLGMKNPFLERFPRNRFSRKICRFRFGEDGCAASPSGSQTCNHTLSDCMYWVTATDRRDRAHSFGGFPGIPNGYFENTQQAGTGYANDLVIASSVSSVSVSQSSSLSVFSASSICSCSCSSSYDAANHPISESSSSSFSCCFSSSISCLSSSSLSASSTSESVSSSSISSSTSKESKSSSSCVSSWSDSICSSSLSAVSGDSKSSSSSSPSSYSCCSCSSSCMSSSTSGSSCSSSSDSCSSSSISSSSRSVSKSSTSTSSTSTSSCSSLIVSSSVCSSSIA